MRKRNRSWEKTLFGVESRVRVCMFVGGFFSVTSGQNTIMYDCIVLVISCTSIRSVHSWRGFNCPRSQ